MREKPVLDLTRLPLHGLGQASPTWWGTSAFMLIEGTGFALVIAIYFYLMSIAARWPLDATLPNPIPGTILTVLLFASIVPNVVLSRWVAGQNLRKVRAGLIVMSIFGILPLIVRAFEFPALHVKWDSNAYGSILWTMLVLHTTHLVTDVADTLVLTAVMFTRHADNPRRYGDAQDNAMYWNFVVATWVPLYLCIYWVPRL